MILFITYKMTKNLVALPLYNILLYNVDLDISIETIFIFFFYSILKVYFAAVSPWILEAHGKMFKVAASDVAKTKGVCFLEKKKSISYKLCTNLHAECL